MNIHFSDSVAPESASFAGFGDNVLPKQRVSNSGVVNSGIAKFAFGTNTTADTLASLRAVNNLTVVQYGLDKTWNNIATLLAAYNGLLAGALIDSGLADITTDRQRAVGGVQTMVMESLDGFGVPRPQKVGTSGTIGAPLRRVGIGMQWTYDYFNEATPAEIGAQMTALLQADTARIYRDVRRAIYGPAGAAPTNYTFNDVLIDNAPIYVKYLANNDGTGVYPVGQNGTTFAGTHQHYSFAGTVWSAATGAQRDADVLALINNVREHVTGGQGTIRIYCNYNDQTYFTGMTNFVRVPYQSIIPTTITDVAQGSRSAIPLYDVLIGTIYGAEIWIKPWVIQNYPVAGVVGAGIDPALWIRVPEAPKAIDGVANSGIPGSLSLGGGNLRMVQNMPGYPIICQGADRRFGIAINNRVALAVLKIDSASAYTSPAANLL